MGFIKKGDASMVVGSACRPLPLGIGYDKFQSYDQSLFLLMIFPIIGIVSSLFAKKPDKKISYQ